MPKLEWKLELEYFLGWFWEWSRDTDKLNLDRSEPKNLYRQRGISGIKWTVGKRLNLEFNERPES